MTSTLLALLFAATAGILPMTSASITELSQLVSRFCSLKFDGVRSLPTLPVSERPPDIRQSRNPAKPLSADQWEVEHIDFDHVSGFLSTLSLKWHVPLRLSRIELERAFGPCRVLRSYALDGPEYHVFHVDDQPLSGLLRLTVTSRDAGEFVTVPELALRRLPPDPAATSTANVFRWIVIADLFATEDLSDLIPVPGTIRQPADLAELIQRLRPMVAVDLPNHLDPSAEPLHLHFHLTSIDDFELDRLVDAIPAASELLNMRRSAADVLRGKLDVLQFLQRLTSCHVPALWQSRGRTAITGGAEAIQGLVRTIDTAVSAQCAVLLADERFQRFQAAWRGLAYFLSHFDFRGGSCVEVYSASPARQLDVMRRGIVPREVHHFSGPVTAAVLLDSPELGPEELTTLGDPIAQLRVPAFLTIQPGCDTLPVHGGSYLAAVDESICLRSEQPIVPPRRFQYYSSDHADQTACWGSGVWAWASLIARGFAETGYLTVESQWLEHPPGCDSSVPWLRSHRRGSPADKPRHDERLCHLKFDPDSQRVSSAVLRLIAQRPPLELSAILTVSPLLQYARRWAHQHAHESAPGAAMVSLEEALRRRFPDLRFHATYHPHEQRVAVEATLPTVQPHNARSYRFTLPWHGRAV